MTTETLLGEVAALTGADAARLGAAPDAVDGVQPRVVASPSSGTDVARLLAWASGEGVSVSVRGGGTKLTWGGVCGQTDVMLSTSRLDRVVEHRHGDLTATIESGAALGTVNEVLARHGQWLPLDPPWSDRATVGGIIATNDSGPRRHAYGTPRDSIIGVTLARPDGALAKAGGIVVKNVAGYDLSRLMTGAFGSLGVVLDATFKLAPRSAASRTTMIQADSLEDLDAAIAAVATSALTPSALELEWPPGRLLVRFESVESAVDQQAHDVERLVAGVSGTCSTLDAAAEADVWDAHRRWWEKDGTLVKMSVLPRALIPTLVWVRDAAQAAEVRMAARGRAGLGVVELWLDGPVDAQVSVIAGLRERLGPGSGSAVIRQGDAALRRAIDAWGPIGDGLPVMRAIKQRFDPRSVLNPGKGPV